MLVATGCGPAPVARALVARGTGCGRAIAPRAAGPPDITGVLDAVAVLGGVLTLRVPRYDGDKSLFIAVPSGVPVRRENGRAGTLRTGQRVAVWRAPGPPEYRPPPGEWAFLEVFARLVVIEADPGG